MKQGKYLVIDTETSGVHPSKNGLIQVGMIAVDSKLTILETYCQDICPPEGTEFNPESLKLTGFTIERIQKGITYPEFCQQFLTFIEKHFPEQPIVVAQFYPFDFGYLESVFSQVGEYDLVKNIIGNDFIDTKSLVNSLNLKASLTGREIPFPITSLSKPGGLKGTLHITENFTAHDALGDAMATYHVLVQLMQNYL